MHWLAGCCLHTEKVNETHEPRVPESRTPTTTTKWRRKKRSSHRNYCSSRSMPKSDRKKKRETERKLSSVLSSARLALTNVFFCTQFKNKARISIRLRFDHTHFARSSSSSLLSVAAAIGFGSDVCMNFLAFESRDIHTATAQKNVCALHIYHNNQTVLKLLNKEWKKANIEAQNDMLSGGSLSLNYKTNKRPECELTLSVCRTRNYTYKYIW